MNNDINWELEEKIYKSDEPIVSIYVLKDRLNEI